jgi:hypothetical protein
MIESQCPCAVLLILPSQGMINYWTYLYIAEIDVEKVKRRPAVIYGVAYVSNSFEFATLKAIIL